MRVLIVEDGWSSYILPAVRSFGAAGWSVGLASPRPSRSASSRWVTATHHVPTPQEDLAAFAAAVSRITREGGYDVAFGGDDVEVLALSSTRESLGVLVPYPEHSVVLRAFDKLELSRAATRAGLHVPRTTDRCASDVELPVVVKPRLHWVPGSTSGLGRYAARICTTQSEVADAARTVESGGGEPVFQELVPGTLMAVTALCAPGGRVVAESHQVATRTSPRLRTSTRARTVAIDHHLSQGVSRLLADLGWCGIANLQFLRSATGEPALIDFNGRFYGSLALAIRAGLDLPVWWVKLFTGQMDEARMEPRRSRTGVRYQNLEEDFRRAREERRHGLATDLLQTLAFAPTAVHSTWSSADPKPAVNRVIHLAQNRRQRSADRAGSRREVG